jgi:hypothetical protein
MMPLYFIQRFLRIGAFTRGIKFAFRQQPARRLTASAQDVNPPPATYQNRGAEGIVTRKNLSY